MLDPRHGTRCTSRIIEPVNALVEQGLLQDVRKEAERHQRGKRGSNRLTTGEFLVQAAEEEVERLVDAVKEPEEGTPLTTPQCERACKRRKTVVDSDDDEVGDTSAVPVASEWQRYRGEDRPQNVELLQWWRRN